MNKFLPGFAMGAFFAAVVVALCFSFFNQPANKPVAVATTVSKTTPSAEWYTEDDPVMDFVSAVSNRRDYAIAGTETWTLCHNEGLKPNRVTSGPKVYLCPNDSEAAIELELPKVDGTNQYFRNATSPCFSKTGDKLIATLHYQCGDKAMLFVTAWGTKTRVPEILIKTPADLCACDMAADELPKPGTLASWYMQVGINPGPKPKVEPHLISMDERNWSYGLD